MTDTKPVPSLNDILGQPRAIEALRSALAAARVHHAWILAGPFGVGKQTTALAFAALLLDPTLAPNLMGELDVDPDSETRRLIASGAHPDLRVITKELAVHSRHQPTRTAKQRTIPIEVLREFIIEPAQLGPSVHASSLAKKVFVIDEAELMNLAGQNALLKTLEEPPPGTVIMLITSHEDRLLPTIRSRCQRIGFHPLDHDAMAAWFERSGLDLKSDERRWIEQFAQGSPGRALLAVETGLYNWATTLDPMLSDLESGRFNVDAGATMAELVNEWAQSWHAANRNSSKEAANVAAAGHMFNLVAERARQRLRQSIADDNVPEHAIQRNLRAIELIEEADRRIRSNVNLSLTMEHLACELLR